MVAASLPPQYEELVSLVDRFSASYLQEAKEVTQRLGKEWDPRTSNFEIQTYFVFLLSCGVQGHGHNTEVWQEMCYCLWDKLLAFHVDRIAECGDLQSIIDARIQCYGDTVIACARAKSSEIIARLKCLQSFLEASGGRGIELKPPVVIGDFIQNSLWIKEMTLVEVRVACAFECVLKHLFVAERDIRNMDLSAMREHISQGVIEAAEIYQRFASGE